MFCRRKTVYTDPNGTNHYWEFYTINGYTFYIISSYKGVDDNNIPLEDKITDYDIRTISEEGFQLLLSAFGYKDVESINIQQFKTNLLLIDSTILPAMHEFVEVFELVDFESITPKTFIDLFPYIDNINSYIFKAEKNHQGEFIQDLMRNPILKAFDEILLRFMIALNEKMKDPKFETQINETLLNQLEVNSAALSKRLHRYPLIISR